jgi:hypothetical protein
VQTEYYIPPRFDANEVKKEVFKDISQKMRTWRYQQKKKLEIQLGETPEMVRTRVGDTTFTGWDPEDMAELLAKWCDEAWQVHAWVIIEYLY